MSRPRVKREQTSLRRHEAARADLNREQRSVLPPIAALERDDLLPRLESLLDRIEVDVGIELGHGHPDHLFATVAATLAGLAIHVHDDAALVAQAEGVGCVVHQRAEALLALAQRLLGALALVDIGPGGVPAYDPPSVVAQRGDTNEEPPVLTVPSPEARFRLPRSGLGKSALPSRRERIDVVRVCETAG